MTAAVVERWGSVAELHALDPFAGEEVDRPQVWWCRPHDDAVVLGSRQTPDRLDAGGCRLDLAACAAAGLQVARRRSGGGLVLVHRSQTVWLDLVVPHGVAPDDVRGAMVWAGERWVEALVATGVGGAGAGGGLHVHRGGMVEGPWSALVCFAGFGPGEVLVDGAKLVGLSQRRTRHGLRIQGTVHTSVPAPGLGMLIAGPVPPGSPPTPAVVGVDAARLAAALAASLDR